MNQFSFLNVVISDLVPPYKPNSLWNLVFHVTESGHDSAPYSRVKMTSES